MKDQSKTKQAQSKSKRRKMEQALKERAWTILENIQEGYYEVDLAGNYTFFNPAMSKILGYTEEEMMGMNYRVYMDKESAKKVVRHFNEVYGTGISATVDYEQIKKDGSKMFVEASVALMRDSSGQPTGFRGLVRDNSERKRAEDALKKSEEYFRAITENASDIILVVDKKGTITYASPSVERILGLKPEELIGKSSLDLIVPEDFQRAIHDFGRAVLTEGILVPNAFRVRHKDGSERVLEGVGKNIFENAPVAGFVMNVRDVTDHRRVEQAMRESEKKYRTIIETMQEGYYEVDIKGNLTFFNESMREILGYEREELLGMNNRQYLDEENANKVYQVHNRIYRTGEPVKNLEWQIVRKDGNGRDLEVSISVIRDREGQPTGFRGIVRDTTDRRRAEESLRQAEERYRSIFDNAQEGIFRTTPEGRFILANAAMAKMMGYKTLEELVRSLSNIALQIYVNPEEREKVRKIIEEKGSVKNYETKFYRKDGSIFWVSITIYAVRDEKGRILYYQGMTEDVTEHKESVERIRKALKATVQAIVVTVEARDPYTAGHQRRVSDLARAIATEMNLPTDMIDGIRTAAVIHDLGKISVPVEILTKPTKLTDLEFGIIKTHAQSGYDILKDIEFPWPIARMVLEHHERMNGSGYPNRLLAEETLLESRILAVADVLESMASHRPYRASLGIDAALKEIEKNKGTLYDTGVVNACLRIFREKCYQLKQT
jgi:PAS domain S-box-containing protein